MEQVYLSYWCCDINFKHYYDFFFASAVYNESTNEIITGGVGNITVSKFKNKMHFEKYYATLSNNDRLLHDKKPLVDEFLL